ncbi:MAG: YceI family protein [Winogradskyella sp.]|uniref:YceI family protein n=1 Tax=Winogradskyella sp. TaxID=1883156 RepID=UPI0017AB58CC|nr:YceI family protein [Winogradskyella sp.]MBT8243655.1 YceI family protein [Winogradskyella sp.]NNK22980.1 YceI family protein [Winogradskyella sp.]
MKQLLVSSLFTIVFALGFAQKSSINFEIRNLGINVDGFFKTFTVTTKFDDSNNLEDFSSEIKVSSIETGIDSRDEHLLQEDYFHTSKYPLITLDVAELFKDPNNEYSAKVNLRIKGKAKQFTIPLKVEITETQRKIKSNFEINRKDFKIGGGSFVMGKTVKIAVVHVEKIR